MSPDPLAPILTHLEQCADVDPKVARQVLADWEAVPIYFKGQLAGCGLLKGTELHFAAQPGFGAKIFTRRIICDFLRPLLARQGYLTTKMDVAESKNWDFVERLGFKPTWHDGTYRYFMLTQLPYGRD